MQIGTAALLRRKPEGRDITRQRRQGILTALLVNNVNINLGTRPNKMTSMNELFIFQISVQGDLNHNLLFRIQWIWEDSVLSFTHSLIKVYKPSNMQRTKSLEDFKKGLFYS